MRIERDRDGDWVAVLRAHAFSGHGREHVRCRVVDGDVVVYDAIARHYTTCHVLSGTVAGRVKAALRRAEGADR
jgi:hypothetical protein